MKKMFAVAVAAGMLAAGSARSGAAEAGDGRWPRTVTAGSTVFTVYQPQMEGWDGATYRGYAAVGVRSSSDEERVSYGKVYFTAQTFEDRGAGLVRFDAWDIQRVYFPAEPRKEQGYLRALRSAAPVVLPAVPAGRLKEDLAILREQQKGRSGALRNDPPRVIFSREPAVLVSVDGDPVFTPLKGTGLSRLVNTQALLLKDGAGTLYLHVFDGYMKAKELRGPWTAAPRPPEGAEEAELAAKGSPQTDLLEGEPDPETGERPSLYDAAPEVHVSFEPAELIVTDGEPDYLPVEGTNLLYVQNTTANVFKCLDDQKNYVLLSGRWFRSSSLNGPWRYVPGKDLPRDFALIPDTSPKENAKASVPGTGQAEEAAIADSIPSTAKVERREAQLPLRIDGEPQLRAVDGTRLQYVFNCSLPVLRVNARSWYAVHGGVWYFADDLGGPWVVADHVPAVIYAIPVYAPLHYVTYVRVYDATPDYVYVGYTPGYYGTAVCADGTVVYGTGFFYPAYVSRSAWYCPVRTYGYGWGLRWTPWYGWSFGLGFGWGYRDRWYFPPEPCWGPFSYARYYPRHRYYPWGISTSGNVYRRLPAGLSHVPRSGQAYNSRTGANIVGHVPLRPAAGGTISREERIYSLPRNVRGGGVNRGYGRRFPHTPGERPGTWNGAANGGSGEEQRYRQYRRGGEAVGHVPGAAGGPAPSLRHVPQEEPAREQAEERPGNGQNAGNSGEDRGSRGNGNGRLNHIRGGRR